MTRVVPVAALLALSLAAGVAAVPAPPTWTVKDVALEGFTASGDLMTRRMTGNGWTAPVLERRDPATGRLLGEVGFAEAGSSVGPLTFTPDAKTLAWLTGEVLRVRTPQGLWQASIPGLLGARWMVFSPDGRTLVIPNENGYVQLWDVSKGKRRATLLLHGRPEAVAFHPDGEVLAVNERSWRQGESSVTLWNLKTGEQVGSVPGLNGVLRPFQFAPDGTLFVPVRPYTVGWVEPRSGQTVRRLPTLTEPCGPGGPFRLCARAPWGASLSADGKRAALSFPYRPQNLATVRLYDGASLQLLKTLDTPLAFPLLSPDGHLLLLNSWEEAGPGLHGLPLP